MIDASKILMIGADEVGYGSIAGPLVATAVAFQGDVRRPVLKHNHGNNVPVRDSKNIKNPKTRQHLSDLVKNTCVAYETCLLDSGIVDRLGAYEAKLSALRASIQRLLERIAVGWPDYYDDYTIIVDGDTKLGACCFKYVAYAKADETYWQCGAASLIAKEAQVNAMLELHAEDSRYGWDKNKGYATKQHIMALHEHGVSKYHRRSFRKVKEILQ